MGNIPDAANDVVPTATYLSMDPDANDSPILVSALEDLETFFYHAFIVQQEVGAAGTATLKLTDKKQLMLPSTWPILIGTNFSQVVIGDASVAVSFVKTIYFKRRRANATDLNQILLKRR